MKRGPAKPTGEPPAKMRTSREVYNLIKWDGRFDGAQYVIGYDDHASPEPREIAYRDFDPEGDIPWHRVVYVRGPAGIAWDRRTRLDAIAAPAPGAPASPAGGAVAPLEAKAGPAAEGPSLLAQSARLPYRFDPAAGAWARAALDEPLGPPGGPRVVRLKIALLNVLSDLHEADLTDPERRTAAALERLRAADADLIALVEVTPRFLEALAAAEWVREGYAMSDAPGDGATVEPMGQLLLSRLGFAWVSVAEASARKRFVSAGVAAGGQRLAVTALHLTADRTPEAQKARARQIELLTERVAPEGDEPWLVLGDFNLREPGADDALTRRGLEDLWPALRPGEPGETFDPARNALAALMTRSGKSARFDRIYVRPGASGLRGEAIELFAEEPVEGHPAALPVSDHYGLVARVALGRPPAPAPLDDPPTYHSALVLTLPAAVEGPVQAIRKRYDRGFDRWPPHVTLVYGFVGEARFAAAARAVGAALEGRAPFAAALARFDAFEHEGSGTVWLAPEAEPRGSIEALQAALQALFPRCDEQAHKSPEGFKPHLTVARFPKNRAAEQARLVAEWQRSFHPLRFEVDRVELLSRRGDEPFARRASVALGSGAVTWHDASLAPRPTFDEIASGGDDGRAPLELARARLAALAAACVEAPEGADAGWLALHPVGSYRLGLASPGADLDAVVVGRAPRAEAHAKLVAALAAAGAEARSVEGALMPAVRARVEGVRADLLYARWPEGLPPVPPAELAAGDLELFDPASARALSALRDADALLAPLEAAGRVALFRRVAALVKRWAAARQVDANAYGYPGGLGWAVVAARACLAPPREGGAPEPGAALEWLFADLAARDGRAPLALSPAHAEGFERGARDVMPVLTPAAPHRNIARNATRSTRDVVRAEAERARALVREARLGRVGWAEWLAPAEPRAECPRRVELSLEGPGASGASGWVDGHIVGLVLALERAGATGLRPFTRREARAGAEIVSIGVGGGEGVALRKAIASFEASFAASPDRPGGAELRGRLVEGA
ncbi:MAG TPA: poly(A) polymerase [Polyangiaceae bacterium]|nr:poly(A) polymerase [Polyangiaceae bacterium]